MTVKRQLIIIFLLATKLLSFGQTINKLDSSVTIIIKNNSKSVFYDYLAVVKGQTIGGKNLESGQSAKFKIKLVDSKLYRFLIYLDKGHQEKYSIEPIDYFSQVSELKIETGVYTYCININNKVNGLDIKLSKTK